MTTHSPKYNKFAKNTSGMFLINIIINLSTILLLAILTKNMPLNEYGLWVQITTTTGLTTIFALLGLNISMLRYVSGEKNKDKIKECFYSIFFIVIMSGLLVSSLIFLMSDQIANLLFDDNSNLVKILSAYILFITLNTLILNFFIGLQKIKTYGLLSFTKVSINIIIVSFFVVFLHYGIYGALIGSILSELILLIISLSQIIYNIGIIFPRLNNIKEYLSLGLPIIPSTISDWVINSSDRYLIGIIIGITFVGLYSPAYTLGNLLSMIYAPISSIILTSISKGHGEEEHSYVEGLIKNSIKYYLFIGIPVFFGLSTLSKPLLTILTTTEIANYSFFITPFTALTFLVVGLYNIIVNIIVLKKKTKIVGITWTGAAVINLILNLILIPIIGILGAAIATLISYVLAFFVVAYKSNEYVNIKISYIFIFKTIISSIPILILYCILNPIQLFDIIFFIMTSFLVYLIIMLILKGIGKKEVLFIKNLLKSFNFDI
ncbi:oligosaccharide flippase family protein [Methanobacterium sp.]|uniref:oligosaccharide flippase family protein n=1 Tax=Methanobacterium sp. TaxID=2164 RepID=UPI0025F3223C|nr:oligosaccharide flippase family protein [Methanobacterium sp.]MBI5459240.1 oligosaccharide flippase family protein [Methanobacterium sp.]